MNDWTRKIRETLKERFGKDKTPVLIVALGVLGMLLLLFSGGEKKTEVRTAAPDPSEAQAAVERKLESLLKTVDGVGKVKVCVTIDRMQADVYGVNTEQTSEPERSQRSEKYVFTEDGSDTEGLRLYTEMPLIRGVGVSCEGGGSTVVRQEVTKLVCAALGIGANRIWVTKMKSQ